MALTFDKQGGYGLESDCGAELGTVAINGATARFFDAREATAKTCRDELYDTSVRTLTGTVAWTIANKELWLTKGVTTLIFGS